MSLGPKPPKIEQTAPAAPAAPAEEPPASPVLKGDLRAAANDGKRTSTARTGRNALKIPLVGGLGGGTGANVPS